MNPLLAAFTAVTALAGMFALLAGFVRVPLDQTKPGNDLRRRFHALRGPTPATRRKRAILAFSVAAGVLLWLFTGWLLAVAAVPAAVLGLPVLLQTSTSKHEIGRLEAMSEWTRNLSGVLGAGIGIEQTIRTSLATTPEPIRTEVARLVARLHARWDTETALRAFADDLDDATGDLIAGALILGAQRRGAQLANVLQGLADAVAGDVAIRRNVEAEQAKPRTTARMVTIITSAGIAFTFVMPFADPYREPFGQLLFAIYLAAYVGCLIWLRSITKTPRQPRILGHHTISQTGVAA